MQKIFAVVSLVSLTMTPNFSKAACELPIECYQQALETLKQADLLVKTQQAENEKIIQELQAENQRILEQNQRLTAESLEHLTQASQLVEAQQAENQRLTQENQRLKAENQQLTKKFMAIKALALQNQQQSSKQQSTIESLEQTVRRFQ